MGVALSSSSFIILVTLFIVTFNKIILLREHNQQEPHAEGGLKLNTVSMFW